MWIPKNPPGGWPVKMLAGIGSLALVHMVFIGGHHVLDDTAPTSVFYPLDRAVETVEILWARLWGSEMAIEARLHSTQERVHETEVMVDLLMAGERTAIDVVETVQSLLLDAGKQASLAVRLAEEELQEVHDDVAHFSMAIFVQSALEDSILRVSNILHSVQDNPEMVSVTEEFLLAAQLLLDTSDALVAAFDLPDDVRLSVREEVRQEILRGDNSRQDPGVPDSAECSLDGQECGKTADCCGGQGLTCMPFQSNEGFTRRCQRTVYSICMTECSTTPAGDSRWAEPRRCRAGYVEVGMLPCSSLVREQCAAISERQPCWER